MSTVEHRAMTIPASEPRPSNSLHSPYSLRDPLPGNSATGPRMRIKDAP